MFSSTVLREEHGRIRLGVFGFIGSKIIYFFPFSSGIQLGSYHVAISATKLYWAHVPFRTGKDSQGPEQKQAQYHFLSSPLLERALTQALVFLSVPMIWIFSYSKQQYNRQAVLHGALGLEW